MSWLTNLLRSRASSFARPTIELFNNAGVMRDALERTNQLLESIEQTPANVWYVNDTDPEKLVSDTYSAVLDALALPPATHEPVAHWYEHPVTRGVQIISEQEKWGETLRQQGYKATPLYAHPPALRDVIAAIHAEASSATSSDGKERDPWAIGRILKMADKALATPARTEAEDRWSIACRLKAAFQEADNSDTYRFGWSDFGPYKMTDMGEKVVAALSTQTAYPTGAGEGEA